MSEIWAVIILIILGMIIYSYISSRIKERNRIKIRSKSLPIIPDYIKTGIKYNIHLSDGRKFMETEIIGSTSTMDSDNIIIGLGEMLVLLQKNGKKVYVKLSVVRFIEEA